MQIDKIDERYAFFLGAGCSVSSGVPDAASLVERDWLPKLRDMHIPHAEDVDDLNKRVGGLDKRSIDSLAKQEFPQYDPMNPAAVYGAVIERVFPFPGGRQREIERLCDGKFPGFGYAVLAKQVSLDGGVFNVILTTNFDDLMADALYLFADTRPLVIHHESLAGYIRPTRTRPIVVKLHGDHRLSPQSTARETAALKEEVEKQVRALLHDRGLIFVGYGGNDQGIKKMLEGLPPEALPWGVYWVGRKEPQGTIRPWLEVRDAVWVKNDDFDEFMFEVKDTFKLPDPDPSRIEGAFQNYR